MTKPLIREDETTFRHPPEEDREKGLAFFQARKTVYFSAQKLNRIATNDGRDEFGEGGQGRVTRAITGQLRPEDPREFGFISESGTDLRRNEPLHFDLHPDPRDGEDQDGGHIWHDEGDRYVRRGFHFSIYVETGRFDWLWNELRDRPNAIVTICLDFYAFEYEVDAFLREPWDRASLFFEDGKHGRNVISRASFYVKDIPRIPGEDDVEEEPIAKPNAGFLPAKSTSVSGEEVFLLKRLLGRSTWVIALLILLLLATCSVASNTSL